LISELFIFQNHIPSTEALSRERGSVRAA
jgi:hypothetical protein